MKADFIIKANQTIEEAMFNISLNSSRCCVVISDNEKVIGIVSEGDIIRALLKGISIKSNVFKIMNRNFTFLEDTVEEDILEKKFKEGITLIPILNKNRELISVVNYIEYFS